LNKIEELCHNLYSKLDNQQIYETCLQQTEANIEKVGLDLYQILQPRRKKDKHFIT